MSRTIRIGTTHVYRVRARAGQQMAVVLKGGRRTAYTVYAPTAGPINAADGVRRWLGELPESGEYTIQLGTDDNKTNYTFEITIE